MRVSVIVPVRDDPSVENLLASLSAQHDAPDFEVLVALDGSRREPSPPASLAARLLRLAPRGPYAARNAAARAASGEILLFTDSDCVCPPDWVGQACQIFRDPSILAIQGGSVSLQQHRVSRWVQEAYQDYVASHGESGYRFFCNTRNFGIRREQLLALPFPERFPRGGDGMYGRQLAGRGIAIRYEPRWLVAHRHPTRRLREARRAFEEGREGAHWLRTTGVDLFRTEGTAEGRGPGSRLLRIAGRHPTLRRPAAAALAALGMVSAGASALLPGRAGAPPFRLLRRAMHLSGRLWGESDRIQEERIVPEAAG
jgi:hypothetical protein